MWRRNWLLWLLIGSVLVGYFKFIDPEPTDVENLFPNPSAEQGTTGLSTGGTNTLAQSEEQQFRGNYSFKVTYSNSTVLLREALSGLTSGGTYYAIARLYVGDWSGGDIRFDDNGFSPAPSLLHEKTYVDGTSPQNEWITLATKFVLSTDVAGNIDIITTSAPGVGQAVYVDSLVFWEGNHEITPFDGDTDLCRWTGTRHNSTSIAPANHPWVGELIDLADDLSFYPERLLYPEVEQLFQQRSSVLYGSVNVGHTRSELPVTISGSLIGTSQNDLHSKHKALRSLLAPDIADRDLRQRVFRYGGADSNRIAQIPLRYVAGLGSKNQRGFTSEHAILMQADRPYWFAEHEGGAVLDGLATLTNTNAIVRRKPDGTWDNLDQGVSGLSGDVYDVIEMDDGRLFVAGSFNSLGSGAVPSTGIGIYDPSTDAWSQVAGGTGLGGTGTSSAYCLAKAANGDIYFGFSSTTVNGITANYIAYYDVSGDSIGVLNDGGSIGVGGGVWPHVLDLAFDLEGNLYGVGAFTTAGGTTVNHVFKWDGSSFSALGSGPGFDDRGRAVAIDAAGRVFFGGDFLTPDSRITRYFPDTDTFSKAFDDLNAEVRTLLTPTGGGLYVGGDFTQVVGGTANGLERAGLLVAGRWVELGNGITNGDVYRMVQLADGRVLVLGDFTAINAEDSNLPDLTINKGMVIWNGTLKGEGEWQTFSVDFPGSPTVHTAWEARDGSLYFGFTTTGTASFPAVETLTNNGTARAYPVIEITGPTSGFDLIFSIINNTTGRSIYFRNAPIKDSQTLILDLRPGRVDFYSYPLGHPLSDYNPYIDPSSDLNWFLAPGVNEIDVNSQNTAVKFRFHWRETHLSIDGVAS